jgi:hypothetical protein
LGGVFCRIASSNDNVVPSLNFTNPAAIFLGHHRTIPNRKAFWATKKLQACRMRFQDLQGFSMFGFRDNASVK